MLALVASLALHAAPLYQPGQEEQERFKQLFAQGEQLYKEATRSQDPSLFGAALYSFLRADELRPTPEVAYDLAKAYEKIGSTPYATFYYRLYLRRSPNASDALEVAERVGAALARNEAEGRGFLEVTTFGATQLSVAGLAFPEGPVALFLAPGDYELKARFASGVKKTTVAIRTGKTTALFFEPLVAPMVDSREGAPEGALEVSASPKVRPLRVASYLVAGLGVLAIAAGSLFGVMSSNDANQLGNHALRISAARAYADSANTWGLSANLSWGAGGALVVSGVVMWLLSRPEPGAGGEGNR